MTNPACRADMVSLPSTLGNNQARWSIRSYSVAFWPLANAKGVVPFSIESPRIEQPQRGCANGIEIMPQSHAAVHVHLVFSTKDRRAFLVDQDVRKSMHAYLGSVSKQLDCQPIIIGGVEDHVHVLAGLGRTITIADWTKELKRVSSGWVKDEYPDLRDFHWQNGYGCFSVSHSNLTQVIEYIRNQEERHRRLTFPDEFRELLCKHGMKWDERYVWD